MNDHAKFLFKVSEYTTPLFWCCTKIEMMAISQNLMGQERRHEPCDQNCLLLYGLLNTNTRDINYAGTLCCLIYFFSASHTRVHHIPSLHNA